MITPIEDLCIAGRLPPRPRVSAVKVMAVTGIVFGLYVLLHMLGNLKAYLGPEEFGSYAVWLRRMLEPAAPYSGVLWVIRVVLLGCLVGHVTCATILFVRARAARGPFRRKGLPLRSFAARTVPVTGVVLLLLIIFHILDLTTGTRPVASAKYTSMAATRSFANDNLVDSFERPWVSAFYISAMLLLGLHLSHGLWLAVNDLGATGHRGAAGVACRRRHRGVETHSRFSKCSPAGGSVTSLPRKGPNPRQRHADRFPLGSQFRPQNPTVDFSWFANLHPEPA